MLSDEERDYWLGFSVFAGIGPIKFKKLLAQFGNAKNAWEASELDLTKVLGEKLARKFDRFKSEFSISNYSKRLKSLGTSFIIATDREYPELLSKIKNPPFLLYAKENVDILYGHLTTDSGRSVQLNGTRVDGWEESGEIKASNSERMLRFASEQGGEAQTITPTIAVVGTRKMSQYGREVTKILTEQLVANGFVIVSGLAIGIDAISHRTAIENNGKTIAVLGCGVDCCYPLSNQHIYNSIVRGNGCVVSEYPLGFPPARRSFPVRNRIIAGLSMGVLVIEGAEDSGALITADYARKFGRPVFAVPGPITSSLSKGPYKLISRGATIVTTADDIFKALNVPSRSRIKNSELRIKKGETKEEQKILEFLQNEPLHFDELVRKTGFDSAKVGSLLSLMEIKGLTRSLDNGVFATG